jgi:2-dehydro-3-deoxygluconokinase
MVALARMGKQAAWVSRLTNNPLGWRIAHEIRYHGVDISRVIWTDQDRNEVFYVEAGASPRPTQVIYDRRHAAVANIAYDDLDFDYLLDTRVLHLTGIFPALSASCADVILRLIDKAKSAGIAISFDVNFRAKLWSPSAAAAVLTPLMERADILIITREDAAHLFALTGAPEEIVTGCRQRFKSAVCVVTLGGDGGIAGDRDRFYACAGYPVEAQERLGAGDCFAAGVLCGYLEGDLRLGMQYASAMSALKLGIRGDHFVSDKAEVLRLINDHPTREVGR